MNVQKLKRLSKRTSSLSVLFHFKIITDKKLIREKNLTIKLTEK